MRCSAKPASPNCSVADGFAAHNVERMRMRPSILSLLLIAWLLPLPRDHAQTQPEPRRPLTTVEPKLGHSTLQRNREVITAEIGRGPNFARHYRIVIFQTGSDLVGVVVIDSRTGSVYPPPSAVASHEFFIAGTGCLTVRNWLPNQPRRPSDPLSFVLEGDLLTVRRCRPSPYVYEESQFRWRGRKWLLLKRTVSPPPLPTPIEETPCDSASAPPLEKY